MIQKLEISGVHLKVDDKLREYVTKKIGRLDQYMSRHSKASVHVEVWLKEAKAKDKNISTCEVVIHMPHDTITTKESTVNIYAAVDIVEAKLKNQVKRYKQTHEQPYRIHRRFMARLRRKAPVETL